METLYGDAIWRRYMEVATFRKLLRLALRYRIEPI